MITNFNFAPTPEIVFGCGKLKKLPKLLSNYNRILLILSGNSFINTHHCGDLLNSLKNKRVYTVSVSGEPTPQMIDSIVNEYKTEDIDVVVAIGGGSVVDCGKAVSAMMGISDSVKLYLEGFELKKHPGTKLPFIAIPTSAGTGAEMTKNTILKDVGSNGFRKSLRHDNFIPNIALIDPELSVTCPSDITAGCGFDVLTHLIESYVSTRSSAMIDTLCTSGIESFSNSFLTCCEDGNNLFARVDMSYASMVSGICLANSGLGTVHGFAASIGGFFEIPHGVVCANLLAPCVKFTINHLLTDKENNIDVLCKYQKVGELLSGKSSSSLEDGLELLVDTLYNYMDKLDVPNLSNYNICSDDFDKIVISTSNMCNPINLSQTELHSILMERI